jgi:hypothetical protein
VTSPGSSAVLVTGDVSQSEIRSLFGRYGLKLVVQAPDEEITASFWGGPEAGVAGRTIFVRNDTPVHSLLHETCHVICMDEQRRLLLDRDAGGDDLEEAAVCYLQVVLADCIEGVGSARLMQDMDAWGYSFRLGSTARWWHEDAEDAHQWLVDERLLGDDGQPVFRLRK